jgi:hypothetical protein
VLLHGLGAPHQGLLRTHRSRSLGRLGRWSMVSGRARHWSRALRVHRMARESPAAATHSLLPRWNATVAVVPLLARFTPDCGVCSSVVARA